MSPRSSSCVLCGNDIATEVRMGMVEWRDPIGKEIWAHVPRCTDVKACRDRVETVLREPWPVADGTPPSPRQPAEEPETSIATPSPVVGPESVSQAPREPVPWL